MGVGKAHASSRECRNPRIVHQSDRRVKVNFIPPDFDANAYLANSWGIMRGVGLTEVVLQFSPDVAALLRERTWHPSQTIDELADGGLLLTVRVSDPREMRPWIRSWGADVEVLEPAELRAEMAEQARRLLDRYQAEAR